MQGLSERQSKAVREDIQLTVVIDKPLAPQRGQLSVAPRKKKDGQLTDTPSISSASNPNNALASRRLIIRISRSVGTCLACSIGPFSMGIPVEIIRERAGILEGSSETRYKVPLRRYNLSKIVHPENTPSVWGVHGLLSQAPLTRDVGENFCLRNLTRSPPYTVMQWLGCYRLVHIA